MITPLPEIEESIFDEISKRRHTENENEDGWIMPEPEDKDKDMKYINWRIENKTQVFNDNGFLIGTATQYDVDQIEILNEGESWLDMRARTRPKRDKAYQTQQEITKLIVAAPKFLEACKLFVESKGSKTMGYYADDQVRAIELMKQAIKDAE